MKTVNKSYKYRIYPNKEQQDILEFNMGVHALFSTILKQDMNYIRNKQQNLV